MEEKKIEHLNVFLVRKQFLDEIEIIKQLECDPAIQVPISGLGNGSLFVKKIHW